jgi:hypothetical protein
LWWRQVGDSIAAAFLWLPPLFSWKDLPFTSQTPSLAIPAIETPAGPMAFVAMYRSHGNTRHLDFLLLHPRSLPILFLFPQGVLKERENILEGAIRIK